MNLNVILIILCYYDIFVYIMMAPTIISTLAFLHTKCIRVHCHYVRQLRSTLAHRLPWIQVIYPSNAYRILLPCDVACAPFYTILHHSSSSSLPAAPPYSCRHKEGNYNCQSPLSWKLIGFYILIIIIIKSMFIFVLGSRLPCIYSYICYYRTFFRSLYSFLHASFICHAYSICVKYL